MAKGQPRTSKSGTITKRGGYEAGPKQVSDLKPPPRTVGAGVKSTSGNSGSTKK